MSSSLPPPPRLALTQAISHPRHLDTATTAPTLWPLQLPPCHPLRGAKHPLDLPSHASWAHTSHPTAIALTVPSAPKKASDKSFPLFFPFIFNGAGHLLSRACRLPLRRRHNHHHLNASTTSATSPTPSPYNRHHPTLLHRQGVQKVRWPPPFPRDPHLLTLPLCVGRSTRVAAPVAPSGLRARPVPPRPARRPPLHTGGRRRDSAPLVPSARAMPHARGGAACKGKGRAQGEGEGPGGMRARGRAACKGEGVRASGAAHEQKGARTLSAPPAPSRST